VLNNCLPSRSIAPCSRSILSSSANSFDISRLYPRKGLAGPQLLCTVIPPRISATCAGCCRRRKSPLIIVAISSLSVRSDKVRLQLDRNPGDLARLISLRGLFDKYKCTAYVERSLFRFPRTCPLDRIQPPLVVGRLGCPGSRMAVFFTVKFDLVVADSLVSDVRLLYQSKWIAR